MGPPPVWMPRVSLGWVPTYNQRYSPSDYTMNKAVLFDLDGVLVETEHLKAAAHSAVVRAFGGDVDEGIYTDCMGLPHAEVRAAFMRAGGIAPDTAIYSQTYRQIYNRLLDERLNLCPGIPSLLERLKAEGYRMALVTSSSGISVRKIFEKFPLEHFFEAQVVVEDVPQGKPDPASYRLALAKLGISACQAAAIEDSHTGIRAAAGSGLKVIAVRHRFNGAQDFSLACQVVESLADSSSMIRLIEAVLGEARPRSAR
jgi:HAD superfamily hydrolase (TIGR01509 family)